MRWFLVLLILVGCGKDGGDVRSAKKLNPYEASKNYFTSSRNLTVEVFYETGSAPYTNLTLGTTPIWQVLEDNIGALFQGRTITPTITVPKRLQDMTEIPAQGKTTWSVSQLVSLAATYRRSRSTAEHSYFWVVFLSGNFHDGTQALPGTIAVSIGGTTIIAVFKDVVRGTGTNNGIIPHYVEQSTIVHEMGHALGLVNNGLPMQVNHQDTAHGHHCDDPDCVMHWLNEGPADLAVFIDRYRQNPGNLIMYGPKCLRDSREY